MNIYEKIVAAYPELSFSSLFADGTIELQNDSDGLGDYIKTWNYSKPIPDGLTLGKPTA
jgi:hypothetical protein